MSFFVGWNCINLYLCMFFFPQEESVYFDFILLLPSCSGMFSTDTLSSLGHTCRRISSVSSPPSLMAMRLRAATSTGVVFRACAISAVFLFRLDSASANMTSAVSTWTPHYHGLNAPQQKSLLDMEKLTKICHLSPLFAQVFWSKQLFPEGRDI